MRKQSVLTSFKRTSALFQAVVLATAAFVPAVVLSRPASASQLGARFIDMSATQTSEGSGRAGAAGQDVTYSVSFELTQAHANIEGIVIDFCDGSPIVGEACTTPTGFNTNFATLATTLGSDDDLNANWAVDGVNSTSNSLILVDATTAGDNLAASTVVEFDLGTAAAADGITNPTGNGTFYARIVTFLDDTVASAYDSATVNANNPGAARDEGGLALAVANELTITARVQEVLEFCIGTEEDSEGAGFADASTDDCTDVAGTDLDLGVVESNTIQTTNDSDIGATNTDGNNGLALIRTNALNGAVVYYKAEQETGLTNGGAGTLRQFGGDDCGTITAVANVCFNSASSAGGDITNPSQSTVPVGAAISAAEFFGMSLREQSEASGGATTDALTCNAEYDGPGVGCGSGAATGYAWDPTGAFDTIASSGGPIDDETVRIIFAATAAPTTPTGLYTVTANFVATSTF